jgi:hypothetical protein
MQSIFFNGRNSVENFGVFTVEMLRPLLGNHALKNAGPCGGTLRPSVILSMQLFAQARCFRAAFLPNSGVV